LNPFFYLLKTKEKISKVFSVLGKRAKKEGWLAAV